MDSNIIVTGVDKLMELVKKKKRLSFEEAAKIIGVKHSVISEWADFLEEENYITIESKLTHSDLVFRTAPPEKHKHSHRQLMKGSPMWTSADIEKKIEEFKSHVDKQVEKLQQELEKLKSLEIEKENVLRRIITDIDKKHENDINRFKKELVSEKQEIDSEKKEITHLKKEEDYIEKKLEKIDHKLHEGIKKEKWTKSVKNAFQKRVKPRKISDFDDLKNQRDMHREQIRKLNDHKADLLIDQKKYQPEELEKRLHTIDLHVIQHKNKINEIDYKLGMM